VYFADGADGDIRARTENRFDRNLGDRISTAGGAALQYVFLDDTELSLVLEAVRKDSRATKLTEPRLSAFNTQRAYLAVVNRVAFVEDFDVEVAQSAAIADPIIGTVKDGLILDIRPTVSHDLKYVTIEFRPTIAQLIRPIPTFVTTLGADAQEVTIQQPELFIQSVETTVKVPDAGSVLIGGLKNIRDIDRVTEVPWLAQIPLLGFFFSHKGRSIERSNLMVVVTANITDLYEEERNQR
jgi:type II secretory pathway component GspD/PulD (secretin)